ncbi:hypothetical protein CRI94_05290 [Longibacter salinarum]|uniref:Type 1 periplasmic binding fold superfamily protein n=1 Tax=Longibacter salinarum TaxID=1850348 RepID=A0A2A8D0N6_9BACT|nr:hypothetical protein [Longibacter salinarum]PEN14441.1 hypothetical protein CRI94_05290 [Longibacter salinarum]
MPTNFLSLLRPVLTVVLAIGLFTACDSNEPSDNAGEQEVISNVTLSFDDPATTTAPDVTAEAVFGSGGDLQSVEPIPLTNGISYDVSIELRDRFNDEDITAEIEEEDEEHRFFYRVEDAESGGSPVNGILDISGLDADANGDDLGLTFAAETLSATSGTVYLRVKLRHYEENATLPEDKRNDTIEAPEEPEIVENDVDFTYPLTVN